MVPAKIPTIPTVQFRGRTLKRRVIFNMVIYLPTYIIKRLLEENSYTN